MNVSYLINLSRIALALLLSVSGLTSCQQAGSMSDYSASAPASPHQFSQPVQNTARPASSSTIQVGDKLDLLVMEDLTFNGQYVVRETGDIIVPKIGRVRVAGSTIDGAQDSVRNKVQSEQLKSATVILDRVGRRAPETFNDKPKMLIYLTGAIRRTGQHFIAMDDRSGLTAYEAVLIGGGPSPYADQRRAYILRRSGYGERERIPVDFRYLRDGYGVDPQLQEGDIVYIPERRFGL